MPQVNFKDAHSFSIALKTIGKSVPPKLMSQVQRKLLLGALKRIVKRTPVDTGRARGNWQVSQGVPAASVVDITSKNGVTANAIGDSVIAGLAPFSLAFITNNLPYIRVLEYGEYPPPGTARRAQRAFKFVTRNGVRRRVKLSARSVAKETRLNKPKVTPQGFSTQAPNGMVRLSFEEMKVEALRIAASKFDSNDIDINSVRVISGE